MGLFKKIGSFAKKAVKSVGKVAAVALPVAAMGAALLPGVGGAVSSGLSKLGEKLKGSKAASAVDKALSVKDEAVRKGLFGIGDGKPGVFGIGDGLPGVFGIGTGKGKTKTAIENREANEELYEALDDADKARLIASGKWAGGGKQSGEGLSPMALAAAGLVAFLVLKK